MKDVFFKSFKEHNLRTVLSYITSKTACFKNIHMKIATYFAGVFAIST